MMIVIVVILRSKINDERIRIIIAVRRIVTMIIVIIRGTTKFAHTTVKGILKGVLNSTFKGNIQHVSIEFLGNHQIRTSVKLYIQGNFR